MRILKRSRTTRRNSITTDAMKSGPQRIPAAGFFLMIRDEVVRGVLVSWYQFDMRFWV